jgi:hypothetical protein
MSFVLDASVALLWLVPETNPTGVGYAGEALKALADMQAVVPSLLHWESPTLSPRSSLRDS